MPFLIGLAFLAAAAIWGAVRYPSLPDRVPVHWDGAGNVDRYADKGVWSVFGLLMVGVLVAVLLYVVAVIAHRLPARQGMSGAIAAEHRAAAGRMIGRLLVLISALFAALSVIGWYPDVPRWLFAVVVWGGTALMLLVPVLFVVRLGRAGLLKSEASADGGADAEQYWRGGLFYVNRDDPAVFVPKRLGVGWSINYGSPAGAVIGVAVLALIAFAIVVPFLHS